MSYPVSIKGVLLVEGGVVLLRNERNEWDLPGGRIEPGEAPEVTLAREFEEELGVKVRVQAPIDSYLFEVIPQRKVFIVTYGCALAGDFAPRVSEEHLEFAVFPRERLGSINLPAGYRRSVERWCDAA